jgi:hypothetical protein
MTHWKVRDHTKTNNERMTPITSSLQHSVSLHPLAIGIDVGGTGTKLELLTGMATSYSR